ncbi:MAG: fumarylacetoacetate hydrolase family protein [Deltaproteobacteria bacterium]|nr:fumarylacetoacetate hydrolase family protein [Deltaproteobacteria bacterium]MBW2648282.1 fumarylacetoacetate hydrolase family protein [Deltaproteobacteria bacterium]
MKIIRFLSQSGEELYGAFDPEMPDEARIIEGDIFGDIAVTERAERIETFLPPVFPPNIIALGLNYGKHAEETGVKYPEIPVMFLKATSSVCGHGAPILLPSAGPSEVDYEAELAVIIGKEAKNVSREDVGKYVLGYTCANDVSARDWQIHKQKKQWARGKSFDTFCPMGPYLVTKDEVANANRLRVRSILNGEVMQDSDTSDMFFDIPAIISNLSCSMTLLPGTVILTGTPEGVGFTRNPPVFLQDGDIITVSIDNIGELTNPVKRE